MNPRTTGEGRHLSVGAFLFVAILVAPFAVSACSHAATEPGTASATAHASMQAAMPAQPTKAAPADPMTEVREAAWAARPAFTEVSARTEEAYRYAMDHPDTLKWLPCYCGCGAMGHGSNLDCYFIPRSRTIRFEEHASYCDVCVDITLKAKQLIAQGQSLVQVRDAIDAEFGGIGPGTDTARPAS